MVQQSGTRATPRLELGDAFWEFFFNYQFLIGTRVMPIKKVGKREATFGALTRASLTQRVNVKRNKNGTYNRTDIQAKDISYACEEYGLEIPKDEVQKLEYMDDFDLDMACAQIVAWILAVEQEIRVAAKIFDAATWTGPDLYKDYSSAPWDTASTDARAHVRFAKNKVRVNCGLEANTMVINNTQRDNLKASDDVAEAIKYTSRMTEEELNAALAAYFGVEKLLVGMGVYNSADEGQTFSGTEIWSDDYCWIGVTGGDNDQVIAPSAGRIVLWEDDSPENVTVDEYSEPNVRGDIIRARHQTDEKIIDPYFGFLLKVDA